MSASFFCQKNAKTRSLPIQATKGFRSSNLPSPSAVVQAIRRGVVGDRAVRGRAVGSDTIHGIRSRRGRRSRWAISHVRRDVRAMVLGIGQVQPVHVKLVRHIESEERTFLLYLFLRFVTWTSSNGKCAFRIRKRREKQRIGCCRENNHPRKKTKE